MTTLRILQIDDMPSAERELSKSLDRIGVPHTIRFLCPSERDAPFGGMSMPSGSDWNEFDLALVDLELFGPESPVKYAADDLRGGTEILPHIRQEAPWLPTVAYSKLFTSAAEHFFPIAAGFGFDGHVPRSLFISRALSQDHWHTIVSRALEQRLQASLGSGFRLSPDVVVKATQAVQERLNVKFPDWVETTSGVFHFAREVFLEPLNAQGFSGAAVFRVFAEQRREDGGRESVWLLKISDEPWKLHQEVIAHHRMMRGGYEFARAVPLLWPQCVRVTKSAAVAYQFAAGTSTAREVAGSLSSTAAGIDERIHSLLDSLYHDKLLERQLVVELYAEWFSRSRLCQVSAMFDDKYKDDKYGYVRRLLREILGVSPQSSETTMRLTFTLIHGDLHLENVLLGGNDLLIDFARSRRGPVIVDISRLFADIVIRWPELRSDDLNFKSDFWGLELHFPNLAAQLGARSSDDWKLGGTMFLVQLCVLLTYDDVEDERKQLILEGLAS
jgi:hypothetical protein